MNTPRPEDHRPFGAHLRVTWWEPLPVILLPPDLRLSTSTADPSERLRNALDSERAVDAGAGDR